MLPVLAAALQPAGRSRELNVAAAAGGSTPAKAVEKSPGELARNSTAGVSIPMAVGQHPQRLPDDLATSTRS